MCVCVCVYVCVCVCQIKYGPFIVMHECKGHKYYSMSERGWSQLVCASVCKNILMLIALVKRACRGYGSITAMVAYENINTNDPKCARFIVYRAAKGIILHCVVCAYYPLPYS